jgi:hypothetical protein
MDFHATFRTDPNKTKAGVPVRLSADDPATITVRRWLNDEQVKYANDVTAAMKAELRLPELTPEQNNEINIKSIAQHVLVGWTGFTDRGVEVPYTVENAIAFLTESPDFRNRVTLEAAQLKNFLHDLEKTSLKNS